MDVDRITKVCIQAIAESSDAIEKLSDLRDLRIEYVAMLDAYEYKRVEWPRILFDIFQPADGWLEVFITGPTHVYVITIDDGFSVPEGETAIAGIKIGLRNA